MLTSLPTTSETGEMCFNGTHILRMCTPQKRTEIWKSRDRRSECKNDGNLPVLRKWNETETAEISALVVPFPKALCYPDTDDSYTEKSTCTNRFCPFIMTGKIEIFRKLITNLFFNDTNFEIEDFRTSLYWILYIVIHLPLIFKVHQPNISKKFEWRCWSLEDQVHFSEPFEVGLLLALFYLHDRDNRSYW